MTDMKTSDDTTEQLSADLVGDRVTPDELLKSANVLVVDDSRLMRLGLIRALNALGVEMITEAGNGQEALDKIRERSFDVMLLDVEMPVMSGIDLLLAMKREPELGRTPVIVISSAEMIETAVKCIEAGAEDYLPKTFNPTLLRARVLSSVEKKRLRDIDAKRVVQLQTEKNRLEQTQARLQEELDGAAAYVRSIFPAPTEKPVKIDWFYETTTELGGDAFGYHWIDADHLAMYLLDVCGHGVGPALLSVTAINQIRAGAVPGVDQRDPGAVLGALNNIYLMEKQNDLYFTLWYGVYHAPSRMLRHASGGHPAALLVHNQAGQAVGQRVVEAGMIIGAIDDMSYVTGSIEIPVGAQLFVPCDGCYEINSTAGKELTYGDFENFVTQHASEPDVLEKLFRWAQTENGSPSLPDDFSIVRFQF
jgi:sigma-B regulation protein RsbU (phosphoserine phosphatase)